MRIWEMCLASAALALFSTTVGCSTRTFPELFESLKRTESFSLVDIELKLDNRQIDIVIIEDNSGSMTFEQQTLGQSLSTWINQEIVNFSNLCISVADSNAAWDFYVTEEEIFNIHRRFCTQNEDGTMKSPEQISEQASAAINLWTHCDPTAGCAQYQACEESLGNCAAADGHNEDISTSIMAALSQNTGGEFFYAPHVEDMLSFHGLSPFFFGLDGYQPVREGTDAVTMLFITDEPNHNLEVPLQTPMPS